MLEGFDEWIGDFVFREIHEVIIAFEFAKDINTGREEVKMSTGETQNGGTSLVFQHRPLARSGRTTTTITIATVDSSGKGSFT